MAKKVKFVPVQPNTDVNRPSEAFAYANQVMERQLRQMLQNLKRWPR